MEATSDKNSSIKLKVSYQIALNFDFINDLRQKGASLKNIYLMLIEEHKINCHYDTFRRTLKKIPEQKHENLQKEIKPVKTTFNNFPLPKNL